MKTSFNLMLLMVFSLFVFASCDKEDEEDELKIEFKEGAGYTSHDATVAFGDVIKIGVEAETEKANDPIIKFTIFDSINGGTPDLKTSIDMEQTDFDFDYDLPILDNISGNKHKLTFTITNKDGINKQISLTLTIQ